MGLVNWIWTNPLWSGTKDDHSKQPGTSANPQHLKDNQEKLLSGPLGIRMPYFLPFFDEQQSVGETQLQRLAYRRMLSDPNIKAPLFGKIFGIAGLELRINPTDKEDERQGEQADFVHWNFTRRLRGGFPLFAWNLLIGGCVDGFSILEPVFGNHEMGRHKNKEVLRMLKPKDVNQDLVVEADQFRNVTGIRGLRYNTGIVWHPDQFVIFHHLPLYGNPTGMSDLRACYDDKTEILTKEGWKFFKDLKDSDEYAVLDRRKNLDGNLAYAKATDKIAYHYQGKMFRQKSSHIDVCVTPDHRLWLAKRNGGVPNVPFEFVRAGQVMDGSFPRIARYKRDAAWEGREQETFILPKVEYKQQVSNQFGANYSTSTKEIPAKTMLMDDWLRFLGIYLAEGSSYREKDNNRQCFVNVCQNPGQTMDEIIDVVDKLGFNYCIKKGTPEKPAWSLQISSLQLWTYLHVLGGSHTKHIPLEYKGLSRRQLNILLEWMLKGDGRHNGTEYCTVSKRLADDVSEVVLKAGFAPLVRQEQFTYKDTKRHIWIVSVNTRGIKETAVNVGKDRRSWEEYNGMVYCVTVPGSLVYVRRNGKSYWCGNCYGRYWFLDTIIKLRAMGAEKRALPFIWGEYPDATKQSALEAALAKVKTQTWAAVPADAKIQALDIAGSASDYFKSFCDDLREEIVMSIDGATLQSMSGRKGQERGDTLTHKDTADLRKWFLSVSVLSLLNDQENGLIKKMIDLNYAEVEDYPYATLGGVDDNELMESLDIDRGLQDMGFKHIVNDIAERYGRQPATDGDEVLTSVMQQTQEALADAANGEGDEDTNFPEGGSKNGAGKKEGAGGGEGKNGKVNGKGGVNSTSHTTKTKKKIRPRPGPQSPKGAKKKQVWVPFTGPNGGRGWQNRQTGSISYGSRPQT